MIAIMGRMRQSGFSTQASIEMGDHRYFFGQNPELPGKILIWSGELYPGDLESWRPFGEILDSLKLDGITVYDKLCLAWDGEIAYLWFTGE